MGSLAKRWVFTLNNPTEEEEEQIRAWASTNPEYLIFGRETGLNNGVPHLQGFVILKRKRRLVQLKRIPGFARAHFEVARGSTAAAADYCKKDGDFFEFGDTPVNEQGRRSDFESFKEWCKTRNSPPTETEIADAYPSLFGRYRASCLKFVDLFGPKPGLVAATSTLRTWQQDLYSAIMEPANDRKIVFVVDNEGNIGKSWFIRFMISKHPDLVQHLSVGKRDDLAFAVDVTKSIFLFDIPREQMEYLQYSVLEQIKDGLVFSPKYESRTKVLRHKSHVVVFCNEEPNYEKLSRDRYAVVIH